MKIKLVNKIKQFSSFLSNDCFLNLENIDLLNINKKVVFYTLAWGDYLDIYFNYTLPSILHKSNASNLVDNGFKISFRLYTLDSKEFINKKYLKQIEKFSNYSFEIICFKKESQKDKVSEIANLSIIRVLKFCLENNSIMFMAPPDTVFSNHSIFNSIIFSYSKRKSFASAHPRINMNFLKEFKSFPKNGFNSNEMVKYVFENAHSNFKNADEKLEINTVYAGISYRKISDNIFAVTSNMPTTFVVIPTLEDINYFKNSGSFNDWDRGWLGLLLKKNRLKISGSSDMFFCAEITKESDVIANIPKKVYKPWKDLYDKLFSHRVSNIFISIWRK